MKIGEMQIDSLIDGEFRLDHREMYLGDNPPTDEDWGPYKRFLDPVTGELVGTVGGYLVRFGDRVALVDNGYGPKLEGQTVFDCGALRSALWAAGVNSLEVTDLLFTHLHLDHIGWTTIDGKPYFPNATIHADERDWNHYNDSDYELEEWEPFCMRSAEDTVANWFEPVRDRVVLFQSDQEVLPGIRALDAAGHSPGHTVFELSSGSDTGFLVGDLAHTPGELVEEGWEFYVNGDTTAALESIDRFRKILYDSGAPFSASHFPGMRWGRIVKGDERPLVFQEI